MRIKRSHVSLLCLFFFSLTVKAQTNLWLDYYQFRLLTNDSWKMSQRASLQYNPIDDYVFTATYRPDYAHKIRQHGRLIVGNGFFYYHGRERTSTLELRPWVGFQRAPHRLSRVGLTHYLRYENRFFMGNSDKAFEGRLRYKLSLVGDLYQKEGKAVSVVLAPEVFVSLGTFNDFYFNRFQVTSGIRYQWSPYWRTDMSVIRQTSIVEDTTSENDINWVIQLKIKRLLLKN